MIIMNYFRSGFSDKLSRIAQLKDTSSSLLTQYTDLGLGSLVAEDFTEPQVKLNYGSTTAGSYPGFDRLNRIQQQLWRSYSGGGADREKLDYTAQCPCRKLLKNCR